MPSLVAWDGEFGRVPSENRYADTDDDGAPDVAIGRLPVQTPEEADAMVAKIAAQKDALKATAGRHLFVTDNSSDEDALFRQNALNCFADPVAVIDGLRRAPIVSHRQHGRFSLRDLEIAAGQPTPVGGETPADAGQIDAAFNATELAELKAVVDAIESGLTALNAMDAAMRTASNGEFVPTFDPLSSQFKKIAAAVNARIAVHPAATAADAGEVAAGEAGAAAPGLVAVGAIKSRLII